MSKKSTSSNASQPIPPFIFSSKNAKDAAFLRKLKDDGRVTQIGPKLFTTLPADKIEGAVKGFWSQIVATLYPDSLLSYRSALEFKPSPDGSIYLTGNTNRLVQYPGITLHFIRGPKPRSDDIPFLSFHAASPARALLENYSVSKTTRARAFSASEMEAHLENILHAKGELEINRLRDEARRISEEFGYETEFKKLDQTLGAMLGTRPSSRLISSQAQARAIGLPFDVDCNTRLELLFADLRAKSFRTITDSFERGDHFRNKAFFEAYFSNYIEGTTFEIEEAEAIIFDETTPASRPQDAHDILATFQIISDPNEFKLTPKDFLEFEAILKRRHFTIMEMRSEALPGHYKKKINRAGDTHFVHPEYVRGTLQKGFEKYQELPKGIQRAIFMMFLVAEVHPFVDGNGRLARIMMNSELYAEKLSTIIIPTVYRDDYLSALKAMSRRNRTDPLIRMLERAQSFSHLEFSPYPKILAALEEKNWFREPSEAKLIN